MREVDPEVWIFLALSGLFVAALACYAPTPQPSAGPEDALFWEALPREGHKHAPAMLRARVPGGWIYHHNEHSVFVPDPAAGDPRAPATLERE